MNRFFDLIKAFLRGGGIWGYISNNTFPPPLNEQEEIHYLAAMAAGEPEARNKLIEHNLRLVAHIAKKFESTGIDKDDLISIGTIGLIKAVNTFDCSKKIKLATYAARCIENEVLMYLRSTRNSRNEVYLQEPVGTDKEGNELTLLELLASDGGEIGDDLEAQEDRLLLFSKLDILGELEREVVARRYGLSGLERQTQREIAKSMGISRSYVSRIEKRAIKKLAKEMSRYE